jgi:hypothetical protein
MIKMGSIGFGASMNMKIKPFTAGSPFSVQANHVSFNSYISSITSGNSHTFNIGNALGRGTNSVDRSPMPFGGKFLKIFVVNHEATGGKIGYVVPIINGAEQTDMKCDFTSTTEVDEEFKSPDGVEIDFLDTDQIGYKWVSTSGQFDFDDWSIMIVMGFNIGESGA